VRDEVVSVGADCFDHGDDPVQRLVNATTPESPMV
jgi:hypothetical protein